MKKLFTFLFVSIFTITAFAQKDPVSWSYAAVKKSATEYEIKITAILPQPWHIYSQNMAKGGPAATKFTFKANPLFVLNGKVAEAGKLKTQHDDNFGIDVKYYSDKVEFTQKIKLKSAVKTTIGGTVNYMVCDDEKCLPPTSKTFSIKIG